MSLLLFGPSAWLKGNRPTIPPWVVGVLPPGVPATASVPPSPKDIRFGLVARLRLAEVKATALELHHDRPDEDPADKLFRIVHDGTVDRFAFYWPFGAVRPAVDIEVGWLLHGLQHREVAGEHVGIFYEWDPEGRKAAHERPTTSGRAVFESLEQERRTTFYQSLVAWGATPIPWSNYEDLLEFLEVFAR